MSTLRWIWSKWWGKAIFLAWLAHMIVERGL